MTTEIKAVAVKKKVAEFKPVLIPKAKVLVQFRAIPPAPRLKQNRFNTSATSPFSSIVEFLRTSLKCSATDPLYLYVDNVFTPSPDQMVYDLWECFHSANNELTIYYCTTEAYS
eukprot:TRINITY_DN1032_c0_g2_i1.p1 TRINITY_DN1032_c0_g2~~TRINITY_DN1032_c0_g2_i1.p1  ORF type:complete len:123 (+),score=15.00 TRINITY_DN1032_c0_g2_i1:30-371(+)